MTSFLMVQLQIESICRRQIDFGWKIEICFGTENIVGKGENASYQHFLLYQQCFQKTSYSGLLNVVIVW